MSPALDTLIHADQQLFLWLNGYHTPFWDTVMVAVTYKFTWIPLYVWMVYSLYARFGAKAVGYFLCIVVVVILADKIASGLFKPYFMRLRPCHDPVLGSLVHHLVGCGGAVRIRFVARCHGVWNRRQFQSTCGFPYQAGSLVLWVGFGLFL